MASFGRHETVRELHRTGVAVVYAARAAGSLEEDFAVKVFQPHALLPGEEQDESGSHLFISSARVQQKAAGSGAQHWAPVYECGSTCEGTFYTTDKYDRSLRQLIDGRIRLSSQGLQSLVESVAEGLLELKERCARPHGNLKATNVLIAGTGATSQTRVVLCDPLPDEQTDRQVHRDADLRAIAEFIYELVIHRPLPAAEGWQVPDSKEWATLGKQASAWRDLCNRLLNARVKPESISLEALIQELAELKKVKPVVTPRRLIGAALAVIACVTILVLLLRSPPPPPEKAEWEGLCREYQGWVDAFRRDLAKAGKNRLKTEALWSKDPQLSKIPAKIGLASYPYKVVLNEGKLNVREIIDHPEYAEQRKTRDAIAAIQDVKNFFDPNSEQAWSVLADVAQTAANFKGRGWQEPAAYLDDLAENVKPEPNKPIVESVNAVLELEQQGTLQRIDSSLQEIAGYQQTIARSEDRILAGFDADYVNRELAAAKDIAELGDKLGRMMELGRTAAELIERDWQTNVDRAAFLNDHGNDSLEGPTEETFNERLGLIKQYYYLRPDPREEIFGLVSKIELYTEQARVSNPKEAAACVKELGQLQPSVEAIRHVKPLEKNRQQIAQNLTGLKPRLQELKDRAERAIETAEEFVTRMKKLVSIAGSETINMKWITLRDNLFNNYPLPKISRDLELYSETRHRTDSIIANLVVLDNTLRKELPAELGVHLKDKDWNNSLNQIYERERKETIEQLVRDIPLRDELPDVNDTPFQEILRGEFSKFEKWRSDLGGILVAFNEVEARLEVCYLLDDKPSADKDTLRSLWTRWKDTEILKEPTINSAMAEPTNRLRTLEAIEDYSDSQELVVTASRPDSPNEAVYAAWIRLGELSWPIELDELNKDRNIRDKLRLEFETIKRNDDRRGSFLLQSLVAGSLNREANFIERKRAGDKVLGKLVKLAREADCSGAFSECQKLEAGAKELADFVAGEDWQTGKVQRELFFADSKVHKLEGPVSVETSKSWLGEVVDYRQLDTDPRTGYLWGAKIDEINELLSKGLGQSSGLTEEALAKLEQHKTNFAAIVRDIDELRALPAIKKNESEIGPDRCLSLWGQLEEREGEIRSIIKPAYCNRLELDNGRLIFASEYLQPNFEPLSNLEQLKPSLGAVLEEDTDLIQKGKDLAEGVVEGGKKIGEDISEGLRDLFGKKKDEIDKEPVQPALTWEHIRQAINNGEREWLDFFYTIDENETQNLGWPTYMRSTKDQSVVLRFIPAGPGNAEPFYMLTHETTNAQYRLFLEKTGAKNAMTLRGWSRYTDPDNKTLIYSTINDKPPCAITWNRSKSSFEVDKTNADIPVAWVTYHGALSYAKWLGGELPAVSQHKYACRANTSSIPPWGDDRSRLASYAHVRAAPWQKAATEWNEKKDAQVPPLPIAPVGAIKGMAEDKSLPTSDIVVRDSAHESIWPRPVDQAQTPNAWGLYDMIGNVWEWCRDDRNTTESVICGGSCLAPPRYVLLNSETDYQYSFNKRASDVGFRTMALAK